MNGFLEQPFIGVERDPKILEQYVGKYVKADRQTILKSLQGTWRSEQLFLLQECYHSFCYYKERIAVCDQEIEKQLKSFQQTETTTLDKGNPIRNGNRYE